MERSPGCEDYREALSARLDGEAEPIDAARTDAHLTRCAGCRAWESSAAEASRLVRVSAAPPPMPDLLAALDREGVLPSAPARTPPKKRLVTVLRVLLGAFGAAQFVLGIAQVADATAVSHVHGTGHLWHESAAWNVAVGAGFGWIAGRRGRPAGALPMLTAFVALLVLLSVGDVLAGRVGTERLLSHGFVLAGWAIVVALTRPALDPGGPPARLRRLNGQTHDADANPQTDPAPATRPAGRRAPLRLIPGQASTDTDRHAA